MAFTGDLQHLHIVDIIQLIHTTRKSGTFSVRGERGESRIIFSNGYIVGANHLNGKIRIGTVLVNMNVITPEDLKQALEAQKEAGSDRKPLIATLIETGKLRHEEASKGLKKLIEMTIVELIGWNKGTFTLDTEAISVSPECCYLLDKMEQVVSLDAQMVLMDALRIYDERERDRKLGKYLPQYEELFAEVIPEDSGSKDKSSGLTAEDLGLADLDQLEQKIPQVFSAKELFDPVAIHRQTIKDLLGDFPTDQQEVFVSYLKQFSAGVSPHEGLDQAEAIILFSGDKLIKHSVMTVCKNEGILVFATDEDEELDSIIAECLSKRMMPVLIFDIPESTHGGVSREKIISLRHDIRGKYPRVPAIQLSFPLDYSLTLGSFRDGIRAVLPRPSRETQKETFIEDTIQFLETFKSYVRGLLDDQQDLSGKNDQLERLLNHIAVLRTFKEPSDVSFALLHSVSRIFERSINFAVRPLELTGEKAMGVQRDKTAGPTSAAKLKIPLTKASVFRDVIEKGQFFYGESGDAVLKEYLFEKIGVPLRPTVMLLPLKTHWKIMTLTYGDFGSKEVPLIRSELFEILANQAGVVLENMVYRKHFKKASHR
ncbi:MAG: DUF4388 domain-containing protein [Nitrospirota bacterium]